METPEALSWAELQERLTRIMALTPSYADFGSKDSCALRVLRLRDIAEFCGIERKHLYFIRRGERKPQLFTPPVQRKLTWFFREWEAGRLVKERGFDGKWRVVHPASQISADATAARASTIQASVDFFTSRLTVKPHGRG